VGLEGILGFTKRGSTLRMDPCIPSAWREFSIEYCYGATVYSIAVRNPDGVERGVTSTTVDGDSVEGAIDLIDDGRKREVIVTLGR
jgi:cyclic beta-1,2-glucan synthetase